MLRAPYSLRIQATFPPPGAAVNSDGNGADMTCSSVNVFAPSAHTDTTSAANRFMTIQSTTLRRVTITTEGGPMDQSVSRRALLGAAAFTIVPRHVLGAPFVPPSDRINIATIGLGRQGEAVTMSLLPRPEVQIVAVCDVNR